MVLGDPMGVILPPRFVPITSPHQRVVHDSSTNKPLTMGTRDVERGMLSMIEETTPDSHMMEMDAFNGVFPRRLDSPWETISMIPIFPYPLIMINRPPRKRMVDQ